MKKLYKKGQVHPSQIPSIADHHLALLPATILTLSAALSAQDKEVLAYLIISCSSTSNNFSGHNKKTVTESNGGSGGGGGGDHSPTFECNCFRCYMSFWARWDASPNRELIHEIIEAYEEELLRKNKQSAAAKIKKEKRKRACDDQLKGGSEKGSEERQVTKMGESVSADVSGARDGGEVGIEKGVVRKIASFIGERIWSFWDRV
jgi:hypothetical protein